jgi:drug/metabolite transporter (DMT)-like permease
VLLFYLMPLWTVLLSRVLLGERISLRGGVRVALALAGAAVVLWPTSGVGVAPAPPSGGLPVGLPDALGLLGGFSFALNNVMLRREARRSAPARALSMFAGGALVSMGLAMLLGPAAMVSAPPPLALGWGLIALAMAAWFLASNLTLQYGAARLPANTTSVIMISEVFFASASALALGAGTLGLREAAGAAMIVGAALLASVQRD